MNKAELDAAIDEMYGKGAAEKLDKQRMIEVGTIRTACTKFGYGNVLHTAAELWAEADKRGGAHVVGPAQGMTVPCGCSEPHRCEWCCGTGWLTERCRRAKLEAGDGGS